MKTIFLILFLCFFLHQKNYGQFNDRKYIDSSQYIENFNPTGYINILHLPNGKNILTDNLIIADKYVESFKIISRIETIEQYGLITKCGALIYSSKPGAKYIVISQILGLFNISHEDRNLPVYINDLYVDRPETIVADSTQITDVAIIRNPQGKEGKVIDIITRGYKSSKSYSHRNYNPYGTYYFRNNELIVVDSLLNDKIPQWR